MINEYKTIVDTIKRFEINNNPFSWNIDDTYIWPLVRFKVFAHLVPKAKLIQNAQITSRFINALRAIIYTLIPYRLLLKGIRTSDIILIGFSSSRRVMKENKYYNVFLDSLVDEYDKGDYIIFEQNRRYLNRSQSTQIYSRSHFFLDPLFSKIEIISKLDLKTRHKYQQKIAKYLHSVDCSSLSITKEKLVDLLTDSLTRHAKSRQVFTNILKKTNPKHIFITCSYCDWNMSFLQIAKSMNISVTELQHGTIHENHFGYSYPPNIQKSVFTPDTILVFGKKEQELLPNIFPCSVQVFGYPYLKHQLEKKINSKNLYNRLCIKTDKQIILVTSQGTTKNFIAKYLLNLSTILPNKYHIILKIHPNEKNDYKRSYNSILKKQNITIVSNNTPSLYELLKISYVHASVYSTVLEEATAFSVPNIIIKHFGWENVKKLLDLHLAVLVKSPQDFISKLPTLANEIVQENASYYYDLSIKKEKAIIDKLVLGPNFYQQNNPKP